MRSLLVVTCFFVIVTSLPVTHKVEKDTNTEHENNTPEELENVLEYERYLKEIVNALETDQDFRQKLDKAPEADIRSGKIAQELEYVNHHVRTKLDEIKRQELERLTSLATRQFELTNNIDREHLKIPEHLDHNNQHTFEIEDLKKLILKTSVDLAEADRKRREEFKEYELQKEFEKQEKLNSLDEDHKKQYETELKKQHDQHEKHDKVHHPGNKKQLEEVWEKQDHMEGMDFDPRTFFMMHDVDSNGVWDENEVKALFVKELDKVYQAGLPEDDMRERAEEMERMREHVFKEADSNKDGLISFAEFLDQTKRDEFNRDPGWDTVDNVPQFTHEEYLEFERKRQAEIQRLIASGALPPHPAYQQHPNEIPQNYQRYPNQGHPNQGQYPNQQVYPNQEHGGFQNQGHPNQDYHNQGHPNQDYQNQAHPNQGYQNHPPGQVNSGYQNHPPAPVQYQPHPNQQQAQHQPPPMNNAHPNQPPPMNNMHPNQQAPPMNNMHPNQQAPPINNMHPNQQAPPMNNMHPNQQQYPSQQVNLNQNQVYEHVGGPPPISQHQPNQAVPNTQQKPPNQNDQPNHIPVSEKTASQQSPQQQLNIQQPSHSQQNPTQKQQSGEVKH